MHLRTLRFLVLLPLLVSFQCDEEEGYIEDALNGSGLLGRWELADETQDGISDLLPKCCQFFEFFPDSDPKDLVGEFAFTDASGNYRGIFEADLGSGTLRLQREGHDPVLYDYALSESNEYLQFTFVENDTEFTQGYRRVR